MADFRIVKKSDVPQPNRFGMDGDRTLPPTARLHRNGALYLSVLATAALTDRTCRILAEFDPDTYTLRFTAVNGEIPYGLSEGECFLLRVQMSKGGARHHSVMAVHALFKYIGFRRNGAQNLQVVEVDPQRHSISILLPAEQFQPCEGS